MADGPGRPLFLFFPFSFRKILLSTQKLLKLATLPQLTCSTSWPCRDDPNERKDTLGGVFELLNVSFKKTLGCRVDGRITTG